MTKFGKTLSEITNATSAEILMPRLLYRGTIEEKVLFLNRACELINQGHRDSRELAFNCLKVTQDILNKLPQKTTKESEKDDE